MRRPANIVNPIALIALATALHAGVAAKKSSFAAFLEEVRRQGEANYIRPNIAPLLGLAPYEPSKAILAEPPGAKGTFVQKSFHYVVNPSTCAVLVSGVVRKERAETYILRTTHGGDLAAAVRIDSKLDSEGKAIRGAGVKVDLGVKSKEARRRFQAELDFWLSGRYKQHWKPRGPTLPPTSPRNSQSN